MGKKETKNVERQASAQELALWQTQADQIKKGIAVAEQQEARSAKQEARYERDFVPDMSMNGASDQAMGQGMAELNNQMPRYAEDTSGVYDQPQAQAQPQQGGGAKGKSAKGGA